MSFPGTGKIWMNGSLVEWADAKIHIASHVIHYGSGVFEGARCYATARGSACFRLDAHMRRLYDSARIYRMEPRVSLEEGLVETFAWFRKVMTPRAPVPRTDSPRQPARHEEREHRG